MNSVEFGKAGESAAASFLRKKGFRILARNYNVKGGELDIVALDGKTLVFAEVKTRSGSAFGTPAEAIGEKKIRLLRYAGDAFIRQQCRNGKAPVFFFGIKLFKKYKQTRNDVAEVYMDRDLKVNRIDYTENAF